ncbi:MAG: hypothetical protein GXO27_02715 [Chlorobi bacterium]|nr:hypothetical protein [Chlorobiota bacterium]
MIADAYTLAGHRLDLAVEAELGKGWCAEGGLQIYGWWGQGTPWQVFPLIALEYRQKNHRFRIGSGTNDSLHGLMAPLMQRDFRYLPSRRETGMSYAYVGRNGRAHGWLNWPTFIFRGDTVRERIESGWNGAWIFRPGAKIRVMLMTQGTVTHRGGQINLRGAYLEGRPDMLTVTAGGAGIRVSASYGKDREAGFFAWALMHRANVTPPEELIFDRGHALYLGLTGRHGAWHWRAGFWRAVRFNAPLGEDMFQTVSRRTEIYYNGYEPVRVFTGHTEPVRTLWTASASWRRKLTSRVLMRAGARTWFQPYRSEVADFPLVKPVERQWDFDFYVEWLVRLRGKDRPLVTEAEEDK